ncbi:MAG: Rne/Rng family ribonuclease [Candidatus Bipolaricaulota bacterium]|nr:Rne/Rng family ribonuclease [Candidatus Bipolaricaulota bacterium]MDW8127202.1 Rne/Rng family ribonuclease [Candidatus Bipolaricaulota bacterium]
MSVEAVPQGVKKRVAIIEEGELVEVHFELPERRTLVGNIYKGKVDTVLPGMGAAFVQVGEKKTLFLAAHELHDGLLKAKGFDPGRGVPPIQKVLKPGEALLVQVRREGVGEKNPQATTKLSLPGRYWVFLPTEERVSVSRRIEDREIARRLRQIAHELKPDNTGLIARTAALHASREDLERDFKYLLGLWKGIQELAEKTTPPKLLYSPPDLIRSIVRDRFLEDVDSLIVDDESVHQEILEFLDYLHLGKLKSRVRLYRGTVPLFVRYGVEEELARVMQRKIPLKGGGFITVDETEALTAIDVNTGSDVKHKNQAAAILNTNLEAAHLIPRILRLRKLSGIIVVDFVDMANEKDKEKVIATLKEELKKDRVPADFIDITKLGLVEITRKKEGESLSALLSELEES